MCERSQRIVSVHMFDGKIERRQEILLWQQVDYLLIIQLALCSSLGGREQPAVGAKLLPGTVYVP